MKKKAALTFLICFCFVSQGFSNEVAITIDDIHVDSTGPLTAEQRSNKTLKVLRKHKLQAALFVCGKRIDSTRGRKLLRRWVDARQLIANHSYSHLNFNSNDVTIEQFTDDFLKNDKLLSEIKGFSKLFRFPFLKEGDTPEKRDAFRKLLAARGYSTGHVSIDASDWFISGRLQERLEQNPDADSSGYRDYYLAHIWDRTQYYDSLSKEVVGRPIKHTLLLHGNLLTAFFLDDLIEMYQSKGWKVIDAKTAFEDPIYDQAPQIAPAGESIVWALAKESGKFETRLRYPAEDGSYEEEKMVKLGL